MRLSLVLNDGWIVVFTVDEIGGHIIISISPDRVLGPCTAHAPDHSTLLGLARSLQLLGLLLGVGQVINSSTTTNLSCLGRCHLLCNGALLHANL